MPRDAQHFLQALLKALPQGVVLRDDQGAEIARNEAADTLAEAEPWRRHTVKVEGGGEIEIIKPSTESAAEAAAGKARADFLAVMSHEIRTPLNGILGIAGLLQSLPDGATLGPEERHYVSMILSSGQALLQMVNDILDFSRLDAGRVEIDRTVFDIRSLVRNVIELLRPEAERRRLDLVVDLADDLPLRAAGDPARLRQVLLNLVGNSLKFTETGSVRVDVRLAGDESGLVRVEFAVIDTGIGIAPDVLEKLFTAFRQADNSTSRRFGGTGLGLAISRDLVRLMGGEIEARSQIGRGTTFRFSVVLSARRASDRVTQPVETRAVLPVSLSPAEVPGLHILIADDNATNRVVASRMLERHGHIVQTVADGAEAVAAIKAGRFDLVLMDMMMPGMDGLEATRTIRAMPPPAGLVPVVGLTANSEPEDIEACHAAGMNAVATKPVSGVKLMEAISKALAARPVPTETEWPHADTASAFPLELEHRRFDQAVVDALLAAHRASAHSDHEFSRAVDEFLARATHFGALLRASRTPADCVTEARDLATIASRFGLLRPARSALHLVEAPSEANLLAFSQDLTAGATDLRDWRQTVLVGI